MDILLLIITIVSLGIAVIMSTVAWRLSREERSRSAARIAALAAAASDDHNDFVSPALTEVAPRPTPWRAPEPSPPRDMRSAPPARDHAAASPIAHNLGDSFLGSAVAARSTGGRQRGLAVSAVILFVVIVTGGYFMIYGDNDAGSVTAAGQTNEGVPLELISLRHERQSGALAVTGLVRNPSAGRPIEKLTAVVFFFDPQGSFLTSSRAGVDFTQLGPGDESPFVVRIAPAPGNVARYRVSFRTEAGVVPHVDRRGQEPIARELP